MRKFMFAIGTVSLLLQTATAEDKKTVASTPAVIVSRAPRATTMGRAVASSTAQPTAGECTAVILNNDFSRGEVVTCTKAMPRNFNSGQIKRASRTSF